MLPLVFAETSGRGLPAASALLRSVCDGSGNVWRSPAGCRSVYAATAVVIVRTHDIYDRLHSQA